MLGTSTTGGRLLTADAREAARKRDDKALVNNMFTVKNITLGPAK